MTPRTRGESHGAVHRRKASLGGKRMVRRRIPHLLTGPGNGQGHKDRAVSLHHLTGRDPSSRHHMLHSLSSATSNARIRAAEPRESLQRDLLGRRSRATSRRELKRQNHPQTGHTSIQEPPSVSEALSRHLSPFQVSLGVAWGPGQAS